MSKAVLAWLGVLFIAMGGASVWGAGIKYSLPAVEVQTVRTGIDLIMKSSRRRRASRS